MKTPTWGYVVGIIMMVFSGCGAMKNMRSIMMPDLLDMQKEIFKGFSDDMQSRKNDSLNVSNVDSSSSTSNKSLPPIFNKNMAETMEKVLRISDYQKTWMVRLGYIGFIPAFIYILAGIFLLIRRKFSLKLAYGAITLSILFSITRAIVLSHDSSFVTMISEFGETFGIIVDVILLIVITACDKSAYRMDDLGNDTGQLHNPAP